MLLADHNKGSPSHNNHNYDNVRHTKGSKGRGQRKATHGGIIGRLQSTERLHGGSTEGGYRRYRSTEQRWAERENRRGKKGWMLIITQITQQNMLPRRPENASGINKPGNVSDMDKRCCHSRNVLLGNIHRGNAVINTHMSCMQQTSFLHTREKEMLVRSYESKLVTFFSGLRLPGGLQAAPANSPYPSLPPCPQP